MDSRYGRWGAISLGEYLVPVNADAPEITIEFVEVQDNGINPLGVKGVGEIGQVGSAAAIANAVFNATGRRIRELPIAAELVMDPEPTSSSSGRVTTGTARVDVPRTTVAVAAVSDALPDRPPISAPAKLQGHEVDASERERAARQPALGLAGILLVASGRCSARHRCQRTRALSAGSRAALDLQPASRRDDRVLVGRLARDQAPRTAIRDPRHRPRHRRRRTAHAARPARRRPPQARRCVRRRRPDREALRRFLRRCRSLAPSSS